MHEAMLELSTLVCANDFKISPLVRWRHPQNVNINHQLQLQLHLSVSIRPLCTKADKTGSILFSGTHTSPYLHDQKQMAHNYPNGGCGLPCRPCPVDIHQASVVISPAMSARISPILGLAQSLLTVKTRPVGIFAVYTGKSWKID